MRVGISLIAGAVTFATPTHAASNALSIELIDNEPVTVRIAVTTLAKSPCSFATPIFEGLLEKGKPIVFANDGFRFCITQTRAPFLKSDFGPPLLVYHWPGAPPARVMVRSRPAPLETPQLWASPLTVSLAGTEKIGVRIAAGTTGPCTSSSNTMVFDGVLEPDQPRTLNTNAYCVCVEQTHAPFLSTGWTPSSIVCRSMKCIGKYCQMDPNAPFEITLASRAP